ncbi:MAG: hypothetical protein K0R92_2826 [Lachnospiraceae bacterium]|jgi:hypothetical protein|nr:hypothetical protein [Lachnospiraceae bacterium]
MIEFLVDIDGKMFEISELVKSVSYTDKLNDGCSKLEFSYIDDNLKIRNGGVVRFINDDVKFYGYIFKHGQNKKKEITVTAYDQLRYCKAKDIIVLKNDTATTLTNKMCNYFSLRKGTLSDTKYTLPISIQDDKTWLDIIYSAISDTLTNKGKWYSLRDELGTISLRDLEDLKLDLVLGDESLVYEFDYQKSIDDNFYNLIKLASENESTGKVDTFVAKDSNSMYKYGILQYFELLDANTNASQAKSKADMLLKLHNRETETLTLNCLGDSRVRAGSSFYGSIEDIALNKRLIVRSVTHEFLPVHTMQIEVAI